MAAEQAQGTGVAPRARLHVNPLARVITIAGNTFLESVRQPVFVIIVACAIGLIALSPALTMFTLMNAEKLMKDMGLATILLAGLLLGAFSASNVIAEEIENKTVLSVISKPVGRAEFILGKYLGIAAALALATYVLAIVLVVTVGAGAPESEEWEVRWQVVIGILISFMLTAIIGAWRNYFSDKPFGSTAMIWAGPIFTLCFLFFLFDPLPKDPGAADVIISLKYIEQTLQLAYGAALVLVALLLLASVAVAASTRVNVVNNIALCSAVFLLGLFSDYMFGRFAESNIFARVAYALVPNLQLFWIADALASGKTVPGGYVLGAGSYAVWFIGAMLALAMALFQEREVS